MASERIRSHVERLLTEADDALVNLDWDQLKVKAEAVLRLDPENLDAKALLEAANRDAGDITTPSAEAAESTTTSAQATEAQPTSFAGGRYEVRRFLGEGGKKKVYLAHDAQLDRDVAFALIKTEGLDDQARERITREAQAMGRLGSHPHIVTVYDIGEENGQPYLVLPVLPGGDVEGVIEDAPDHRLSIEQAVKIASETCLGLEFSHAKGIIHRDLKPGNVWLAEDGRAMIGDFGLAVAVDRSRLTQAGMMVGTVNYMPPEQAMGGEVTPQSDLYSLGCMLYEMVCGRPPFVGDEHVAIIGQHLNTPPVAPTWHRPECPPGLEALILRLLEKDAGRRPASAAEVHEALSNVEHGASVSTEAPTPAEPVVDPLYRRTFVGRENETRQLHQAYDAAVSGQGGLVMIAGEPGIGKTALCEQLETYVSLRGGKTLFGHCYEEGSMSLPYLAFVEAMRTYVLERDPEALRSEMGTGAGEVARIVSEVRDKVHVELHDASDPEDDRWRLLNAIATFLGNAAQVQPLVIVLEDLHWADRGTLDLLLHVARNLEGSRLLVVGTYRDVEVDRTHPLSATLADLRRVSSFLRVPLRGLTVDEVHRMYEAIRGNAVPRGQAEAVHRATEGNPLFVQEILRYLVEEGMVVRQDGEYVATSGVTIPEGLRDVVGRRLGHLGQKANEALSVAAVIGRDFSLDVLQDVVELPPSELEAALEEASERSIIEQRQAPSSIGFRFTHSFFRQVLYEEIFAPRRIRWHQRIGRALEDVYSRRLDDHAAELAEHFSQSTESADLEKAVRYGALAAQRAMSVFDYGEAVRHLDQAFHAQTVLDPDDSVTKCDLLLALGDPLLSLGEGGRVHDEVAPEALALAEQLADDGRAYAACKLGLDATLPNMQFARYWLDVGERHVGDDRQGRIRLARGWATVYFLEGRFPQANATLREAMELARGLADLNWEYAALWGLLALGEPSLDEKRSLIAEYHSRSRGGASARELAQALACMAREHLAWGERAQAEELASELESVADHTRHLGAQNHAKQIRRLLSAFGGQLDEEAAAETGPVYWVWNSAISSWLGLKADEPTARGDGLQDLVVLAMWAGRNGDIVRAEDHFREAMSTALIRDEEVYTWLLAGLLEVAILVGDTASIYRLLESLERRDAGSTDNLHSAIPRSRIMADAAAALGDAAKAREYYDQCRAHCERCGHRPELALTRAHLAELLLDHYPDERDAAIEHLDFAIAEFQDMKMQPALERALGRRGLLKA